MKLLTAFLATVGLALAGWSAQSPANAPSDAVDLVLPNKTGVVRLQPLLKGQKVDAAWHAFLADWFEYFDRDSSGWLSLEETARIFGIPTAAGEVTFDFKRCDANNDGQVTLQELKQFYLNAGFRPVQAVVEPPSLLDLQVADAIFRHLTPDKSGVLAKEKLHSPERLLSRLDENEDEVLTMAEVLSLGIDKAVKPTARSEIQCIPATKQNPLATLALTPFNTNQPLLQIDDGGKRLVRLLAANGSQEQRLCCGNVVLAFTPTADFSARAVATSRAFVLAQFHNAAGSQAALDKNKVANDPALQLLADIFPHADRDGDCKLSLKELERFLSLLEKGATCVHMITVSDQGRNLFCHLDTSGNGSLDLRELKAASAVLTTLADQKQWQPNDIPLFARVAVGRGTMGAAFGPLPLIPASAKSQVAAKAGAANKAPAWFLAMDTNGDGYVSRAEFLGPMDLFQLLDSDGDGLISIAEAVKFKD
jgi:Ca2+-binding EF-hand superfamily protein